jgi:hypothetical protein
LGLTDQSGDYGRGQEHKDHEIGELVTEHAQGSASLPLCDLVRTDSGEAPLRLMCIQPLRGAL